MSKPTASKPPISESEIRDLISQAQAGNLDSKEKVFYKFLPLAYSRAQAFANYGVPIEDLRQESCYGLLLALDHYDVNRPETFATLARHYMDKYVRKALHQQNNIVPGNYKEDFYFEVKAYLAAKEKFKEDRGYEPSEQDMSELMSKSLLQIRRIRHASESFLQPGLEFDLYWVENCYDESVLRPLEEMFTRGESPWDALGADVCLTSREKEVLERRLGFTPSRKPETYSQISADMGLSMNTLKTAYSIAIGKIRDSLGVEKPGP